MTSYSTHVERSLRQMELAGFDESGLSSGCLHFAFTAMPKAIRQQHEVVEMHILEADMIRPKQGIEELSGSSNYHGGAESHWPARPPRSTHIERWTNL